MHIKKDTDNRNIPTWEISIYLQPQSSQHCSLNVAIAAFQTRPKIVYRWPVVYAMAALFKHGLSCYLKPRLKRGLRPNGLRSGPSVFRPMAALNKRGLR